MKKIILGMSLLCFVVFGLQSEAFANNSHHHKNHHHSDHYVVKHKKIKERDRDYHRNNHRYHRNHRYYDKVVYRTARPYRPRTRVVYTYPPTRYVSYYEPLSIGFGYTDYSSGFHINLGFD